MRITLISIVIGLLISACSKNEPEQLPPFPNLTNKPWVMTGWVIKDGTTIFDIYKSPAFKGYEKCVLDDTLVFFENRTYQTVLGEIACLPEQVIFGNGKWEIDGSNFQIAPTGYSPNNFKLIELSDTLLSFSKITVLSKKNGTSDLNTTNLNADEAIEILYYKH